MIDFRLESAMIGNVATIVLRYCPVLIGLLMHGVSSGATSVDVCREPPDRSQVAIAYYTQEAASFEGSSGETDLNNLNFDFQFWPNKHWSVGAGHRYTILNVERLELQTNGHLHTFFFPLHKQSGPGKKGFRFSIAPAFSASSNVASDLDEYTVDAFQLLASAVWKRQLSDKLEAHYGFCGDHRFGKYQIYPVFEFSWQPGASWTIDIGFPASQISHRLSETLGSSLRIAPNGNEWYVKDESLQNNSDFVYEAYLLELGFSWQKHEHFSLTAIVGREFHGRYEMSLLNEDRVRLSSDSANRVGVEIAWTF